MPHPPLLELRDIAKSYGGARALNGVSLSFRAGEIHALVGENGAGKSTLIRTCTGLQSADSGTIIWNGTPLTLRDPQHARALGIRAVHQEAEFFPELSLSENLMHAEGVVAGHSFWINWEGVDAAARKDLSALALDLPVEARAASLGLGQRMMAEIAACVAHQSKLLFLDEPTASLSVRESEELFVHLDRLRAAGTAIVYVSHRLDEVLRLADHISVLRDGKVASFGPRSDYDRDRIVREMVGREVRPGEKSSTTPPPASTPPGEVALDLAHVTDPCGRFTDISLQLRAGEIVALYGLVGAGRSELAQALVGLRPANGKILLQGRPFLPAGPADALPRGLALVPEDRRTDGIFATHSCRENITVPWLGSLGRAGFFSLGGERTRTNAIAQKFSTRYRDIDQPITTLSGGNQQKLLIGRWLETEPAVLIVDEPTRGVDVGAKAEIHDQLRALAARGKAVLAISSDLPEVLQLGDRVLVLREGRLSAEFTRATATETSVVQAALPDSVSHASASTAAPKSGKFTNAVRELGTFGALAVLVIALTIIKGSAFASAGNLFDVLAAAALVSIAAAGMAQVIIAGGIDISIGSMLGLSGALACTAATHGVPPILALALGVAIGATLGAINATIAYRGRIHPIVVTLAGIYIFRGVMIKFTGGYEVGGFSPAFRALAEGNLLGMPKVIWIALAVHLANAWFLAKTLPGRRLYAVGGSEKAARLAGINPTRVRLMAFAISGGLVGLASVLWGAYFGKIQSNTGTGFELSVIAATVIGGCAISGGRGKALGVVAGAVLIQVVYNALILLQVSGYWQGVFVGALILGATGLDGWLQRRANAEGAK
jgi:rhamnose transport system ATP-binding protein